MAHINRDEWLKALKDAGYEDPGVDDQSAITIAEFAAMMNIPEATASNQLRALVARGKAERTQKRQMNTYGRRVSYVAYRLTTETRAKR